MTSSVEVKGAIVDPAGPATVFDDLDLASPILSREDVDVRGEVLDVARPTTGPIGGNDGQGVRGG